MSEDRPSFTCPCCRVTSYHGDDVRDSYCFRCHWWTRDPLMMSQRPDLEALKSLHGAELDAAIGRKRLGEEWGVEQGWGWTSGDGYPRPRLA